MATRALLMLREASPWAIAGAVVAAVLSWLAVWILQWAWWRPRRLDMALRAQGLKGTRYRLFTGDVRENARINRDARTKPLPVGCHDISPRVLPMLDSVAKEHGKLSFTWFGPTPRVMIRDPELVREVLTNKFGHFGKLNNSRIGKLLSNGVANLEGEKWAKHRRILNPAFHHEKIKEFLRSMSGLSFTILLEMLSQELRLVAATRKAGEFSSCRKSLLSALQSFQTIFIPGYWILPTENNRRMRKINQEMRKTLHQIIQKREKGIRNGETKDDDLLGLLVKSNMSQSNGAVNLVLTTEDIIEECKLFYFAGMETTSVLLTWTLILLSMHPEWQERARKEVLNHFGNDRSDFDSLSRLKIVTMILHEVLRLYPPVTMLPRRSYKEMLLGGVKYPAGVSLMLPILFIHHDSDIWGEDAGEFNPERFAEGVSNASKHQAAFLPFGGGPRICLGQNFALLEAKVALCAVLRRFAFELSPSYVHAPYTVITLHPQHGAQIKLTKL